MRINLTQHESAPEQECAPRTPDQVEEIKTLLTFHELPDLYEVTRRAQRLAALAKAAGATEAMIGGAPYLVVGLDPALRMVGIEPIYAFSKRESVDETQDDGSIIKRTVFRHLGFVRLNPDSVHERRKQLLQDARDQHRQDNE